jgi:hypothetical protein
MHLLTWNTQGVTLSQSILSERWQGFAAPFAQMQPDVIFVQEAGPANYAGALLPQHVACNWNPGPSFQYYQHISGLMLDHVPYSGIFVPWQAHLMGNPRCGMTVLWRSDCYDALVVDGVHDGVQTHRPVFWVGLEDIQTQKPAGVFGCIHAPAGVTEASSAAYVDTALNGIVSLKSTAAAGFFGKYVLCGDFNIPPDKLDALLQPGHAILAPGDYTQTGGRTLDYLVHPNSWGPVTQAGSAGAYVQSDHLQVRFL